MKNLIKWALVVSVAFCSSNLVIAQPAESTKGMLHIGMASVNPEQFNSTVFPRLNNWGLDDAEINRLMSFSLIMIEQRKAIDYGVYATYAFNALQGEATYFTHETVLNPAPAHVGESRLSIQRVAVGMHIGTDVLALLSQRNDLNFEWNIRARAGLGVSAINGKVNRYALVNRRSELDAYYSTSLFAEAQLDTEWAFKLSHGMRLGVFASLLQSRATGHNLGEITRRPADTNQRVTFDYSGISGGLVFGIQF